MPEKQGAGADWHRPASCCIEAGELGFEPRLTDPESVTGESQTIEKPNVMLFRDSGRTTGRTSMTSEGGIPDPDLAALVAAWPTLPARIRAAVLALVGTVNSNKE